MGKNRYSEAMFFLRPTQIVVPPDRGRKDFKNINTLMESIDKLGLIQPCVVAKTEDDDDKYLLIAGERRYRSMCILGWEKLPCITRDDLTSLERKEVELEENLRRENLAWDEEIELYRQIDDIKRQIHGDKHGGAQSDGWTTKDTAENLGMSKTNLYRQIKFAKFLKENPEYKKDIENLPLNTAMKKVDMIQLAERNKRLLDQGLITVSVDLRLGDCLKLIKEVPDASVDLLLTDIPYGIEAVSLVLEGHEGTKSTSYKGVISESDNLTKDDIVAIMKQLVPELRRVLKPSAHFYIFHSFAIYTSIFNLLQENNFLVFDVPIIWDKGRTTNVFKGYEYMACFEPIMYGHVPPKAKRFNLGGKLIINYQPIESKLRFHAFEKPQALLTNLIRQSTNIGDMILDPFAGSSSTLIAAKKLNRNCIGFEINEDNYHRSLERISQTCIDSEVVPEKQE